MAGGNSMLSGGNGLTAAGMYDDPGESIRTPSGRVVNLKRRGSVNDRMRSLDIQGVRTFNHLLKVSSLQDH